MEKHALNVHRARIEMWSAEDSSESIKDTMAETEKRKALRKEQALYCFATPSEDD